MQVYTFTEEKEANGFTFYGVGNGTQVEPPSGLHGF